MMANLTQDQQKKINSEYKHQLELKKEIHEIADKVKKITMSFKESKSKGEEGNPEELLKNI